MKVLWFGVEFGAVSISFFFGSTTNTQISSHFMPHLNQYPVNCISIFNSFIFDFIVNISLIEDTLPIPCNVTQISSVHV